MNVLITGAAGFIASHLTDRYLAQGDRVVGIDNFVTGSRDNITQATANSSFTFLEGDITRLDVEQLRGLPAPELILHCASPASPVDYAQLPLETLAVNSIGTRVCLEAAVTFGARFLFASTSETYGDPLEHPQRESYWGNVNPVGVRSCYDEGKRFGEALAMAYHRKKNLDARIIRIFNTYGPRMRRSDGRVVPNFIAQALAGEPLTLYGEGAQTRSFCYVSDLVEGIMACASSPRTTGEVVNLGNPDERSIAEFARAVSAAAGVPLKTVRKPMPSDDPTRRCPDISKARALLGWEPTVPLEEGLRLTVESFRLAA
ncbi:MAG: NAD-dependent dehydratase [Candidatus Meridianibacter frigidus]|nr:MAG: NAD-dependent dehydratase [Candidatus Eremiobacteraeota bacterium]